MTRNRSRFSRPIALLMLTMLAVSIAGPAAGCVYQEPESMKFVIRTLKGKEAKSNAGIEGEFQLVSVWKQETVQTWAAVGDYGRASASTVTQYWGEPPSDDSLEPSYSGGHLVGATATSTSCGDDPAHQIGTSFFYLGVYYQGSDSIVSFPIEPHPTESQLASITDLLGEPKDIPLPTFPLEHPTAQVAVTGGNDAAAAAEEAPGSDGFPTIMWVIVGSAATAGVVLVWARRTKGHDSSE